MKNVLLICSIFLSLAGCKSSTAPETTFPTASARQRISGFVKDMSSDAPISGAFVTLSKPDSLSTLSDASGYFKFDSLPTGIYTVAASASGYGKDQSSIRLDSGVNASVTLRLTKNAVSGAGTLDLHIVDSETNSPIGGALVAFLDTIPDGTVVTVANGSGTYDTSLVPGVYSMASTATGFEATYFTVTIQAGKTVSRTIRLAKYVPPPPPPPDTLLCLYRFSGNATDSSGNGHNGTKHGCTYVADRFGNAASALQLNGTTDYISIPDAADLNFGKTGDFSISFWIYCSRRSSTAYLIRKGTGTGDALTGYDILADYNTIVGEVGTTYGATETSGFNSIPGDTRWHFIVVKFNRTSGIYINIDNEFGSSGNGSTSVMAGNINTSAPLLIGGDGTTTNAYKGIIDDVRIHKGVLSYDEIDKLYHENGW